MIKTTDTTRTVYKNFQPNVTEAQLQNYYSSAMTVICKDQVKFKSHEWNRSHPKDGQIYRYAMSQSAALAYGYLESVHKIVDTSTKIAYTIWISKIVDTYTN